MCGRYLLRDAPTGALHSPWQTYWRDVQLEFEGPRYNICPGQKAWVATATGTPAHRRAWGFKPAWSNFAPVINARAETVFTSKMFRQAARHDRCLILADGFYEPRGPKTQKHRPWYVFEFGDRRCFAFAGVLTESGFAILTCDANEQVGAIHERMPVILPGEHWQQWLDATQQPVALAPLLRPRPYPGITRAPVADRVKRAGVEGPECLAPPPTDLLGLGD